MSMAMSSLQIGLAVAGGLVLAAVVAHGAWTSRKNAPLQAQPEEPFAPSRQIDPTLGGMMPNLPPLTSPFPPPTASPCWMR